MIKNNISSRAFYTSDVFNDIYNDYLKWKKLDELEKNDVEAEYKKITTLETPALALKRHGTLPPDNWQEITKEIRKNSDNFYEKHPLFLLKQVLAELKSLVENKTIILVNEPRKGRASIKQVNVLKNDEYLVFIYNRLVNSSQTSIVFSGVPIKYLDLIEPLGFLAQYLPKDKHNFIINERTYNFDDETMTFYDLTIV